MNLEIRPCQPGDMQYCRQNPYQDEVKNYPELPVPEHSFTMVCGDEVVGVGGIVLLVPGVGEGWVIMTKQSDPLFGLPACRAIRDKVDSLACEMKLRRCEANVRAHNPVYIRFIEALGFSDPCERKNYFAVGVSSLLYSKVYG